MNKQMTQGEEVKIIKLKLDKENRMVRVGFGKNKGSWFARIDLWFVGYRVTRK